MQQNINFSIVIPTLQKNTDILNKLLSLLNSIKEVSEIILIDNSLKGYDNSNIEKLRVIIPSENLYVNPSWNYGVSLAKCNYIGILNDDILIPEKLIEQISVFLQNDNIGLIGSDSKIDATNNIKDFKNIPEDKTVSFKPIKNILNLKYWGIMIFGHKNNFSPIPEDIKIWCGDNYLLKTNEDNGKINYQIIDSNIKHFGSLSCSKKTFNPIKYNDILLYSEIDKQFKNHPMIAKKHKVIRLFGIKISIKQRGN